MAVDAPPAPLIPPTERDALLALVEELAGQLRGGRRPLVGLDTQLEDDLGLDSLARMELLLRVQRRFGVSISEAEALAAETPRQLLAAVVGATSRETRLQPARPVAPEAPRAPDRPTQAATLLDALLWFAERDPDRVHVTLCETEDDTRQLTYGELLDDARRVAVGLAARGVGRGQAVALMLPTGREFFVAFFGIWLAGAVAVPVYPPFRPNQLEEHLRRQARILENARAVLLVGSPDTARAGHWLRNRLLDLRVVATVAELRAARVETGPLPRPSEVALLQYTSGSTGDPKGVVLTHANLIANVRAIGEAIDVRPTDVVVSWLPLYHDMGLIGAWLGSLYHGCQLVVMPPTRFLARPDAWLRAIHRYGGTLTAAPNFAYDLCASKLGDAELLGLDLGSLRLALNGSEPVSAGTLRRFARRFGPHGFRPEAMTPVYGLAENCVALTFTPAGRGPRMDRVARIAFEHAGELEPAGPASDAPLTFVSSGRPIPHHEVRIVDHLGHELPDRRLGHIQFRGPSATKGYFGNPQATHTLLDESWLNTGDLGYIAEGELYVTGRSKDVVIRAGRHIFPYDLEEAIVAIPGIRRGGVAVFSAPDEKRGTEKLVIVAETTETDADPRARLRAAIDARAVTLLGTAAEEVVLVPPRTVPKTSSGKTRRAACRELYLRGNLGRRRSARRQLIALSVAQSLPLVRRTLRAAFGIAYAGWFWLWLGLLAVPAWILAIALPGQRLCWRGMAAIARTFFLIAGIPLEVDGRQHLAGPPRVTIFNHASYLDAIALVAALPPGFSLVAKGELESTPFLRRVLRRLGVTFVERFDARRAAAELGVLEGLLRHGTSLVVFPEGTNRRIPGLFPFHEGAFLAAAHTGAPVVPGGIAGTRAVLRADQWFPRRASIRIKLGRPIQAAAPSWEAALLLRDRARQQVSELCGEPLV